MRISRECTQALQVKYAYYVNIIGNTTCIAILDHVIMRLISGDIDIYEMHCGLVQG